MNLLSLSNIELCNDGRCKRVRMGEARHEKHIFTNNYLKKTQRFQGGVSVIMILLIALILLFHNPNFDLEYKDRWAISIALLAVIVSVAVSMTNLHFKNKQLQTSSLFKVFDLLSSPDIRESRKAVHKKYCEMKGEEKKIFRGTKEENDADRVLSAFDQISATVLNGLLDKDLVFDVYGEMVVRDWKTLKDEINLRQNDNTKTLRHFTFLKNDFEEILKKNPNYKDSDTEPYCPPENL